MTLMIVVALSGITAGCSANTQAKPLKPTVLYSLDNAPPVVQRIIKATNSAPYIRATATNLKFKLEVEAVTQRHTVATFTNGGLENIQIGFNLWELNGGLPGSNPCYLGNKINTIATIETAIFPTTSNTYYSVTFIGKVTVVSWHWKQTQGHGFHQSQESSAGKITVNAQQQIVTAMVNGDQGRIQYTLTYPARFKLPRHPIASPVCPV